MSAATKAIDTAERAGDIIKIPVAAAKKIFAGTLVAVDASGNANPAANTAALRVVGRAEEDVDNSAGSAGDLSVRVKRGVFEVNNSATYAVTAADRGKNVLVEDDNTVANTASQNIKAGVALEISSSKVWIDTRPVITG